MRNNMQELDRDMLLRVRKKCLKSLFAFCQAVMGFDDIIDEVHGKYCRFLETKDPRKQVTMPRSFVKTWIGSIAYPIWITLKREKDEYPEGINLEDRFYSLGPNMRILVASYVIANSMKMIGLIRKTYERNVAMKALFPEVIPENFNKVRWSNSEACIKRSEDFTEATFEAGGIGGSTTSRHYDLIIEDDLIYANKDDLSGRELQPNQEDIDKAIGWHKLATSLLVPGSHTRIHNIGTRWAKHDLVDYIWTNEPGYKVFKIAITKDGSRHGEPTWPGMYGQAQIDMIFQAQGFYMGATQYLLQPMAPEDMMFKEEWLEKYESTDQIPLKSMRIFTTVDLAGWKQSKRKTRESRGVIKTCGWTDRNHCYILRYDVGRFDPSEVINILYSHYHQLKPEIMAIEVVYYQEALMHFLKLEMETRGWLPVRALTTSTDVSKELRIRSLEPYAMNHAIHCRVDHKDFIDEFKEYVPNSPSCRKDMLDALAYQLQIAKPGMVEEEISKKRVREEYKFSIDGEEVIRKLMDRGKPKGIFGEYQTKEDYDPYNAEEFEEAVIKKWTEED